MYGGVALLIGFVLTLVSAANVWLSFLVTIVLVAGVILLYIRNRRAMVELEEARAALEEANAESGRTRATLREEETELEETKAMLGKAESKLNGTRAKLGETIILLDDCIESGSNGTLRSKLKETEQKLKQTKEELGSTEIELDDERDKLEIVVEKLDGAKEELENKEKNLKKVKYSLKYTENNLEKTQEKLDECRDEIEGKGNIPTLAIENVESDGEVLVKLTNKGKETERLGGCSMVDGDDKRFRFPETFNLGAGDAELFEIKEGFDVESTEPVRLYCGDHESDEPDGLIGWRR